MPSHWLTNCASLAALWSNLPHAFELQAGPWRRASPQEANGACASRSTWAACGGPSFWAIAGLQQKSEQTMGQFYVINEYGLKTDHAAAMVQKPGVGSEGGQALVRRTPSLCSRALRQILDSWSTGKQKTFELPSRGGRSNTCIIINHIQGSKTRASGCNCSYKSLNFSADSGSSKSKRSDWPHKFT